MTRHWRLIPLMLAVVALWIGVLGGIFQLRVGLAEYIGRGQAHIRIQSADSRLAGYEHFFNLCASVQADEASIDAQASALTTVTDPADRSRITQNIAALHANRARSISQYNADAAKDYTVGQFRASALPYQLPTAAYVPFGAKTSCAS